MAKRHVWTDEIVESLKAENAKGLTASQIATALNSAYGTALSRNAVVGKLDRLGIGLMTGWGGWNAGLSMPRPPKPVPSAAMKWGRSSSPKAVKPTRIDPSADDKATLTLVQLTPHTCRWPVGEPKATGFGFCGAGVKADKPYCPMHCERAFQPNSAPNDRRKLRRAA